MSYINKVWRITDLIKVIGRYKKEFETISDIEKLNSTRLFQHLVAIIFSCKCDNGVIKYDNRTGERLNIRVCKCDQQTIIVRTELFKKYKRIPYYCDTLFLDKNSNPVDNQRILADWILHDQLLLPFFRCSGEVV